MLIQLLPRFNHSPAVQAIWTWRCAYIIYDMSTKASARRAISHAVCGVDLVTTVNSSQCTTLDHDDTRSPRVRTRLSPSMVKYFENENILHPASCEIEDFVETHLCKLSVFLVEAWIASAVIYACTALGCLCFSLGYFSAPEWLEPVLWPRTWLCEVMWEQQQQLTTTTTTTTTTITTTTLVRFPEFESLRVQTGNNS